jgi:8-oxo-dGTP diphosphatase
MEDKIVKIYGQKVRVRVCGICWDNERLLLVNHSGITSTNFWAPPGGGIEFGQSIQETLTREFSEETGLQIKPGKFLFGCEFIHDAIHAIELFYSLDIVAGSLITGFDPEAPIIEDVRFMSPAEIEQIPAGELHGIFRMVRSATDLQKLSGFFRI